jgi:CubicO group peptidase (beta-lactamase class C family)
LDDITIAQLATHTAGFQKNGIPNAPDNDKYSPLLDQPGTVFRYSDGGLNWLADILTNVYKQDLETLLIERVWNVLGVSEGSDVEWRSNVNHSLTNAEGIVQRELASGMTINIQSMARVGLLFLRDGKWQDTQVFAPTFDDLVRTPRPEVTALEVAPAPDNNHPRASDNYGVLWWTNAAGELPDVPTDAYWGWGQGDSLIVVIPSLDIVIARAGRIGPAAAGRVWGENEWTADYSVLAPFLNPIVQSVQQ